MSLAPPAPFLAPIRNDKTSIRLFARASIRLGSSATGMISLQVFYEGNVQGVGFRWTIRQIAKGFDVIGWVRNLPDGRVELQVGGEESEVFAFVDSIMESELRSHIDKQTRAALAEPVKARGFDIRHD